MGRPSVGSASTPEEDPVVDALRRLRQRHMLSQRQTCRLLGVGLRTLQRWESGAQAPPAYLVRALRDLSRELSQGDDGSLAALVDEFAYVRALARLARRARARAADPPPFRDEADHGRGLREPAMRLATLPSGLEVPCVVHEPDLIDLNAAGATLGLGDAVRIRGRTARVIGFESSSTSTHAPGLRLRVEWSDDAGAPR